MGQKYVGVTLPIRMGQTGMFEQSTTVIEQTRSNFRNLMLTKKGERISQPDLGCDIWNILFDPMSDETAERARLSVVDAIERWLPFLELVDFELTSSPSENRINITCSYRFRSNPNVVDTIIISAPAVE